MAEAFQVVLVTPHSPPGEPGKFGERGCLS